MNNDGHYRQHGYCNCASWKSGGFWNCCGCTQWNPPSKRQCTNCSHARRPDTLAGPPPRDVPRPNKNTTKAVQP